MAPFRKYPSCTCPTITSRHIIETNIPVFFNHMWLKNWSVILKMSLPLIILFLLSTGLGFGVGFWIGWIYPFKAIASTKDLMEMLNNTSPNETDLSEFSYTIIDLSKTISWNTQVHNPESGLNLEFDIKSANGQIFIIQSTTNLSATVYNDNITAIFETSHNGASISRKIKSGWNSIRVNLIPNFINQTLSFVLSSNQDTTSVSLSIGIPLPFTNVIITGNTRSRSRGLAKNFKINGLLFI